MVSISLHPSSAIALNNLSCMCAQSCPTFCDPSDPPGAFQAPLSIGFPRQEYWSGLPFPSPEDLPDPRIEPECPALAGRFFTTAPSGKPVATVKLISFTSEESVNKIKDIKFYE